MVQYDATQLDALKENFTRAINIARERGAFETFSAKVNLGKVGLCENMFDDYKGDGVREGWMRRHAGVLAGAAQDAPLVSMVKHRGASCSFPVASSPAAGPRESAWGLRRIVERPELG